PGAAPASGRLCVLRPPVAAGARPDAFAPGGHEVAHLRIDPLAPAAAAEDPVVAGAGGREVLLVRLRDVGAQVVRHPGLPGTGDVVELALDGEERHPVDRGRIDPDLPALEAHVPQAPRQ